MSPEMGLRRVAVMFEVITGHAARVIGVAALVGHAISGQDKYTLQVPNGLAFSEFKGYEDWQTVSVSRPKRRSP